MSNSRIVRWPNVFNWGCKIGLIGFSLTIYNGESDVAIENAFVFGLLFLTILSLGVESLLRLYSAKQKADLISIEIAGAISSVALFLTMIGLDQISDATNYKISLPALFVVAFAFSYSICFLYLLSSKPK